ncbi:ABC transporter ATP-binding protein [Jiangella asiatica]|uniref:ABC transporter ATP-binding protein n=1 Tax=Jiangella asiatica TaxID=2530372 RepID=A0A4R5DN74_9ACTN|nr:ABC transporter ATP-binding protein [Jiangella asiatica]TDE13584.1 ABC transporter ATP-binding protein [Jiangella asiatica]
MTTQPVVTPTPTQVGKPIFDARNLVVTYASKHGPVTALDDVSLSVHPGQAIGLIGESGSGKTTLARSLLGLITPNSGRVLYRGRDVYAMSQTARFRTLSRDASIVFQDPRSSLNPRLTIGSVIADPMRVLGTCPRREIKERVQALLDSVGLSVSIASRPVRALSGGQLQRVAIARALAVEPSVIVADEPTSALDMSIQGEVLNLLQRLRREHDLALIIVSHDMRVIRFMTDITVVMNHGKIVERNSTDDIYEHPREDYTRSLMSATPRLELNDD